MTLNNLLLGVLVGGLAGGLTLSAAPICPTTIFDSIGADSTGCGILITVAAGGAGTVSMTGTGPYDGSEDSTVGVINDSNAVLTTLTVNDPSGDAFGFDGDGIQTYAVNNGVTIGSGGATGYEGPDSTFSLDSTGTILTVTFSPGVTADGGNDYFSLEGNPAFLAAIAVDGGGTPEPGSLLMLGGGLALLGGLGCRRRITLF